MLAAYAAGEAHQAHLTILLVVLMLLVIAIVAGLAVNARSRREQVAPTEPDLEAQVVAPILLQVTQAREEMETTLTACQRRLNVEVEHRQDLQNRFEQGVEQMEPYLARQQVELEQVRADLNNLIIATFLPPPGPPAGPPPGL